MNDLQAIARAHRIGQRKKVQVYRLITRNCYEQEMFKRADQKLALQHVVMGDVKDMSKKDIDTILKKGAISMFLDEKKLEEEIDEFDKADIEEILASRTEKVEHKKKESDENTFSQAIFVAEKEDAKIDINDPGFWNQIGLTVAVKVNADNVGPRKRRRPKNYIEDFMEISGRR